MDLSTKPAEAHAPNHSLDVQKARVAKSVFSIASLVDDKKSAQDGERSPSEFSNAPFK